MNAAAFRLTRRGFGVYVSALGIAAIAVVVELAAMYFWLIFGPFPEGVLSL